MADRSGFAAFVAARQGQLLPYAYALCGDWPAAEDVVQVSLEKLYVAWPRVVMTVDPQPRLCPVLLRFSQAVTTRSAIPASAALPHERGS